jgi:hypothetical protein
MDSKGTSVLVNKKCTTDKECQRNKVGCVEIDSQKVHSEGYAERSWADVCPVADVRVLLRPGLLQHPRPTNSSNAIFDDKITKMRMLAKNLFREREKALTTTIKDTSCAPATHVSSISFFALLTLFIV